MKKTTAICLTLLLATTLQVRAQVIDGFKDIVAWAGTGANQSALVIQWNDTKSPVALTWGFRWDTGAAPNVNDMLLSVMQANVGLFARGDSATGYGAAYYGFGYSSNFGGTLALTGAQNPAGLLATVTFVNGFSDMNVSSSATESPWSSINVAPAYPADRYQEGWNDNGFWAQLDGAIGTSYSSTTWTASGTGTSESLVNNGWYGFTFGGVDPDTYASTAPLPGTVYAAVPEPVTLPLMLLATGILLYARKRLHAC